MNKIREYFDLSDLLNFEDGDISSEPPKPPVNRVTTGGEGSFEEMKIINAMILAAKENGVLVEVVMEYGNYRASGDEVLSAAVGALYDWDVPCNL